MPFKNIDRIGIYGPKELALLHQAYILSCEIMDDFSLTKEDRYLLARSIFRIFDKNDGFTPREIARRATDSFIISEKPRNADTASFVHPRAIDNQQASPLTGNQLTASD